MPVVHDFSLYVAVKQTKSLSFNAIFFLLLDGKDNIINVTKTWLDFVTLYHFKCYNFNTLNRNH